MAAANRWDEKPGLGRDAVGSPVIDVLEAQEIDKGDRLTIGLDLGDRSS
jgi:hypothetical protein